MLTESYCVSRARADDCDLLIVVADGFQIHNYFFQIVKLLIVKLFFLHPIIGRNVDKIEKRLTYRITTWSPPFFCPS